MKYAITVKTNARMDSVEKNGDGSLRVLVKAPPREGRANEAVIAVLADHFGVPKNLISILSGFKSKRKVVCIESCSS